MIQNEIPINIVRLRNAVLVFYLGMHMRISLDHAEKWSVFMILIIAILIIYLIVRDFDL